ncbi:3-ketosteroid delta(1)-dehydrogenase [Caenibius tardaugens NBRC 16725]|uniref:3-ketosteroid delta(1)-dehydrogenase n=1 Tax=Caenibius tardaugens NBRC 16725 TaxID=1219035 RepID=U2YPX0_9SPHN|nr:FAD-binding protein [Caenibius tardaugens]AZI35728.1 FAD-binding protein [Caenibius tardaugens NBRC 16725]GAD50717.1 3-ketosteroid delta(1)-dehydrogenase [Caenibius tardaugens NBRC 16725]
MSDWDETCDVLVVGSGAGGMVAAYTAAREGLDVIQVEATDQFGGMTAYSGGGMWFPCNAALVRAGSDDTMEAAAGYYRAVVGDRTPRDLQDAFLETGRKLVDYLESDPRFRFVVFPWPDYFGKEPLARADGRHIVLEPFPASELGALKAQLRPALAEERRGEPAPEELEGGQALIGRFLIVLSQMPNVRLHRDSPVVALIRDGDRVDGAIVGTGDAARRIRARRGVIIAAGGFEKNAGLRTDYGVPGGVHGSMAPPGNTGTALEAALAIGADVDLMDQAWWSPGLLQPDGSETFSVGIAAGIFVDQKGKRFVNETLPYDRAGRAVIRAMEDGLTLPYWLVYDNRDGDMPPVLYPNIPFDDPAAYRAKRLWRTAPTLAALAQDIGVPADALIATVERYNGFARAGHDADFHRGEEPYEQMFTGGIPMGPIEQGPFHAVAFGLSDLGTKGGLRVDTAARVLDRNGAVIPGLYAAGNSMAAVSGEAYPAGGNPVGSSMVFAWLGVRDLL